MAHAAYVHWRYQAPRVQLLCKVPNNDAPAYRSGRSVWIDPNMLDIAHVDGQGAVDLAAAGAVVAAGADVEVDAVRDAVAHQSLDVLGVLRAYNGQRHDISPDKICAQAIKVRT